MVEELSQVEGLSKILVAEHEAYKGFLPGNEGKILAIKSMAITQVSD